MKIALLVAILELSGGLEKLALDMYRALEELKYNVIIYTYYSASDMIERALNLLLPNHRPRIIAKPLPKLYKFSEEITGGRLFRFWKLVLGKRLLDEAKRDNRLLIDVSSNAPTRADIVYIHFPSSLPSGKHCLHWRLYDGLVRWLGNRVYGEPRLVLANSSWTIAKFKELYGTRFKTAVLHPCVDDEFFLEGEEKRDNKMIITISRFAPEKNIEKIIYVAREMPEYSFYLVGTTGRSSRKIIENLRTLIEDLSVKNVTILTDVPRNELRKLLNEATFYLHPPFPEHFGIAVAEAVASGCIPVVYTDGGAWTDIASKIDLSLGYSSISETPKIVKSIIAKGKVMELREKARKIAREFTFDKFKEKLMQNILSLLKNQ
ncbi:MAG: glycosyltransferase [Candidatus Bathyarchaeia archaeon]